MKACSADKTLKINMMLQSMHVQIALLHSMFLPMAGYRACKFLEISGRKNRRNENESYRQSSVAMKLISVAMKIIIHCTCQIIKGTPCIDMYGMSEVFLFA